ncbi:AraC family transcriptional regulator [Oxalobacteraceae bacterium OM1]|nr:AraC family transcriptional regulator [Oxalobacteraceae bacterium OM1]
MIDAPEVLTTTARKTARIHLVVPRSAIQKVMGPGLAEIQAALKEQGIAPAGPWLTHHLRLDPATFDVEICVPVDAEVAPAGRVQPGLLPAARVARTTYRGPYEGLGAAWGAFKQWIARNGYREAPDLWEVYLAGPESSPRPEDWRTEFNQPLLD